MYSCFFFNYCSQNKLVPSESDWKLDLSGFLHWIYRNKFVQKKINSKSLNLGEICILSKHVTFPYIWANTQHILLNQNLFLQRLCDLLLGGVSAFLYWWMSKWCRTYVDPGSNVPMAWAEFSIVYEKYIFTKLLYIERYWQTC